MAGCYGTKASPSSLRRLEFCAAAMMRPAPDEECDRGESGDCAIAFENMLDHRHSSFSPGLIEAERDPSFREAWQRVLSYGLSELVGLIEQAQGLARNTGTRAYFTLAADPSPGRSDERCCRWTGRQNLVPPVRKLHGPDHVCADDLLSPKSEDGGALAQQGLVPILCVVFLASLRSPNRLKEFAQLREMRNLILRVLNAPNAGGADFPAPAAELGQCRGKSVH